MSILDRERKRLLNQEEGYMCEKCFYMHDKNHEKKIRFVIGIITVAEKTTFFYCLIYILLLKK